MSTKQVTRDTLVCDGCGLEQVVRPWPITVPSVFCTVTVTWPKDQDICRACQVKALEHAASERAWAAARASATWEAMAAWLAAWLAARAKAAAGDEGAKGAGFDCGGDIGPREEGQGARARE